MPSASKDLDRSIQQLIAMGYPSPTQHEWQEIVRLNAEERAQLDAVSSITSMYHGGMLKLQEDLAAVRFLEWSNGTLRGSPPGTANAAASTIAVATATTTMASMTPAAFTAAVATREATGKPQPSDDPPLHDALEDELQFTADLIADIIAFQDQHPMHMQDDRLPPGTRTLLVLNFPTRFTQDDLTNLWPADGTYDLLYMPWSSKQRRFSGRAFVSFGSEEDALRFHTQWHGQRLESHGRAKVLKIVASHGQGLEECLLGLRRDFPEGMTPNHLPGVFELGTGRRLEFRAVLRQLLGRNGAR